jgi:hypothetical protein
MRDELPDRANRPFGHAMTISAGRDPGVAEGLAPHHPIAELGRSRIGR